MTLLQITVTGVLANLRSGRGLFGEEATMNAVSKATDMVAEVLDDGEYSADDKWQVIVSSDAGPSFSL